MRRSTSEVAEGMPRSDTVSGRLNTVPTGAPTVSMPHPASPLRNNSCPGQLLSLQELGGQERTRLEMSPSSSSHAVTPTGTEQLSDTAAQLWQGMNKTKKGCPSKSSCMNPTFHFCQIERQVVLEQSCNCVSRACAGGQKHNNPHRLSQREQGHTWFTRL
jgi:hypothetical protein